jgi:methyl-accepting chemotaxis protein
MLNRLRIGPRLLVLLVAQALILIAVGLTAVAGLRTAAHDTAQLNQHLLEQVALNEMNEALHTDLFATVNDAASGRLSWNQAQMDVAATKNLLVSLWDEYQADKSPEEIAALRGSLAKYLDLLMLTFSDLEIIFEAQDQEKLAGYQDAQLKRLTMPFIIELNERIAQQQLQSEIHFQKSTSSQSAYIFSSLAVLLMGLAVMGALGFYGYRSIAGSINTLATTVSRVAAGDDDARTDLAGSDELSTVGQALDQLLDERTTTLVNIEQDNQNLNDVVTVLLQAVAKLGQRDLTTKIPVSEDVTGPIAIALNQFTGETAQVLIDVRRIAEQVAKASVMVRTQSDIVIAVATNEQSEIEQTSRVLAHAASTLNHVAELAQACDQAAEGAIEATHTALQSVTRTVDGISGFRSTIHETEKRIKRLGERSHDIGRAISLINSIAERTHILALNASMHAASAGEAGRGFSVVVDEVKRLAENARDATHQIATLVANIQTETHDTVLTMNNAITQAVAGSRYAEQAGEHMLRTKNSTAHLVDSVRQIAKETASQILLSTELQGRAHSIQASTRKTREQMQEQTQHTKRLVQYSKGLLTAVQVFTLPREGEVATSAQVTATDLPLKLRAS